MVADTAEITAAGFLELVGDPLRWALLGALAAGDRRVGELTTATGKEQSLVSYHLGQLLAAGLVSARRSSADGRDTYYRAELGRCRDLFTQATGALHPGLQLQNVTPVPAPRPGGSRLRVLFLCTGNSARSQMAEALLGRRSEGTIVARSGGSHPKPLHPNAVRVMAERGIDIATWPSKHVSRFARSRFDRVITLCDKVKEICPELPGRPTTAHWSMADPSAAGADDEATYPAFVRTAEEIEERVALLIAHLAATSTPKERT